MKPCIGSGNNFPEVNGYSVLVGLLLLLLLMMMNK